MSLLTKSVPITTASDGTDTVTVRLGPSILRMIRFELGTLSTPDIAITEQPGNKSILSVAGVAANTDYLPTILGKNTSGVDVVGAALPSPVLDRVQVAVTGGGDTLTGRLVFFYEH